MSALRRAALALAVLLCLTLPASALAATHLNAYSLEGDFICVSCHEPLNQVNSPEAQAEKQTLAELVSKGLTYKQIKTNMVSDYGEEVLAEPPAHGVNLLVYILPPLVLISALGFVAYNLPKWRTRARAAAAAAPVAEVPLDPDDEARLNEELKTFDA